ncbi:glycoside hydrolase family 88 protein [Microlunatus soli]|uniref:D-glucuronyl C5-epimerase C-terminus n=1 Tax=Microlunatus soli TaxID=630515 RepID=A0A1H1R7J2_9ACTN|nr:hypothetical protein [Microlunatus soli]SDS31615.1 hypothetical protein SAMN04489812_1538 [Microlunatus soli]
MTIPIGNRPIGRRRVLLGALAAGTASWALGRPSVAGAAALEYDGPGAFDIAEQAYFDQGFTDNEGGGYAWGASYYLLGLLRMYQAHRDRGYLDRFADYADTVLNRTDTARGVTDYAGRSGDVWRTAGNYTAAHGTVTTADGTPAVQVRWAGTRGAETSGTISAVVGDRFTLTLNNPTAAALTLTDVSLDPADDRYLVALINAAYKTSARWTAVELREQPAAAPVGTTMRFAIQYYVFAVHTGMISYPLAKFARIVLDSDALLLDRLGGQARRALGAAERAAAFHDHEYRTAPDGSGDYVFERGAPIPFDGAVQPYNQSHAMGQTLAELYRATGDTGYRDKVEALLASYMHGLRSSADGAYSWPYWAVNSEVYRGYSAADDVSSYTPSYSASQQVEDISHAAISVEFVHAAADAGIRSAQDQLPRFAATYRNLVVRSDTEVWYRVDGTGDAAPSNAVQCARWGAYAQQDVEIYRQALRVYEAAELVPNQGSHALGIGYLNWGRLKGRQNR